MGNFVSGRTKGETPKSSFYFSFRPLTKFPKADLGVWRSGSGSEIHFEHVQLCVHSYRIAFSVKGPEPDIAMSGSSPSAAGMSGLGPQLERNLAPIPRPVFIPAAFVRPRKWTDHVPSKWTRASQYLAPPTLRVRILTPCPTQVDTQANILLHPPCGFAF